MISENNYLSKNVRRGFIPGCCKSRLTKWMLLAAFIFTGLSFSLKLSGQAANIDQIRNSLTYDNSTDPLWVNGNAGSSNSHYMEGYSIAYRVLLTGLTAGKTYSIVLGYDTKHSDRMAIDYLTHYQRLEPHGPFGHAAEVINPLRFESGSNEYLFGITTGPFTLAIPAPDPDPPGYAGPPGDGSPVANQPINSFNALPAAERVMTLWNGSFVTMNYTLQQSLTGASASAETQIRIKFMADDDSVLFSWGGHIASRLDWGLLNGVPRSAAGISGSPYHMRLKQLFVYNGAPVGNKTCEKDSCEVGLGNQDRSLSAQAVIPPPDCSVTGPTEACPETESLVYTTSVTGVTYQWELLNNTANAIISGSSTGQSITVTPNPDAATADFTPGGIFNVKLTTTSSGISTVCYLGSSTAPGTNVTITNVEVDAQDADNALQLNLNASGSIALGIQSISPGTTADYNFLWKIVSQPAGGNSSITNSTSENATFNVLSPFALGVYTVRVIATQKAAPNCKDSSTVTIDVSGGVNCRVKGPSPVCPGSQDNVYFYDPDNNDIADPIPADFTAAWTFDGAHPSAEFDGSLTGNTVKVDVAALGSSCNTSYTVKLTLTSTSGITVVSCIKAVSVEDNDPPVITQCPADQNLSCGASTDPEDTGEPQFTDNCSATAAHADATVSNCNRTVITRTWTVTDLCGNATTCIQTIILTDNVDPVIVCPPHKTGVDALECGASILPANTGTATATDNCSALAGIIIYYKDAPAINVPCGTITRTWYAVDEAGNESSCVQNIEFAASSRVAPDNTDIISATDKVVEEVVAKPGIPVAPNKEGSALQVQAFPNPFKSTVTFRFSSPESGYALLEVYNILGQKLGIVYEGFVDAGAVRSVQYQTKWSKKTTVIYKLSVNGKTANGKLFQE